MYKNKDLILKRKKSYKPKADIKNTIAIELILLDNTVLSAAFSYWGRISSTRSHFFIIVFHFLESFNKFNITKKSTMWKTTGSGKISMMKNIWENTEKNILFFIFFIFLKF